MLATLISIDDSILFWASTSLFGAIFSGRFIALSDATGEGLTLGVTAIGRALAIRSDSSPPLDLTDPPMIAMTLSTYVTSVWIWVLLLPSLIICSVVLFGPMLRLVSFLVDVEEYRFCAAWPMFAML